MDTLELDVVTQEESVFSEAAEAVTAPGSEGEITVLPKHVPLFTKLKAGEVRICQNGKWQVLAIAGGFMDVAPDGSVTVLADSAARVDKINLAKAEEARKRAEEDLKKKDLGEKEYAQAAASLRRAVIEIDVVRKYRRRKAGLPGE